jgi:hypothetical protein
MDKCTIYIRIYIFVLTHGLLGCCGTFIKRSGGKDAYRSAKQKKIAVLEACLEGAKLIKALAKCGICLQRRGGEYKKM